MKETEATDNDSLSLCSPCVLIRVDDIVEMDVCVFIELLANVCVCVCVCVFHRECLQCFPPSSTTARPE